MSRTPSSRAGCPCSLCTRATGWNGLRRKATGPQLQPVERLKPTLCPPVLGVSGRLTVVTWWRHVPIRQCLLGMTPHGFCCSGPVGLVEQASRERPCQRRPEILYGKQTNKYHIHFYQRFCDLCENPLPFPDEASSTCA